MGNPYYTVQVSVSDWLKLPNEVRMRLREIFKVPRSEATSVMNSVLLSDGTTYGDLSVISVEAMQTFLGSKETDFKALYDQVLSTIFEEKVKEEERLAEADAAEVAERKSEISQRLADINEEVNLLSKEAELVTLKAKPTKLKKVKT